jgi:O-antigen ligase
MGGGVVASLYAVVEYGLGRNPLLEIYRSEIDVRYFTSDVLGELAYRCFSVYGNPLEFATVMGMIFPFAAVRAATAASVRERLAFGTVAAILALGVALTFSRGPMLALVVGCGLTGIVYRQLRPWIVGAAVAAAAVLAAAWPFIGAGVSDRIGDVDNMTLRLKLWETALAIFADHPLRGVGFGNFPAYYLEAARENHIGPFYEFGAESVLKVRVAENAYLQLAAETGVIGMAAGLAAVVAMLGLSIRQARCARDPRSRNLATAIALSIVIYACNGLFVTAYTFYFGTLLLMGFLPGCLLVIDRAEAAGASARPAPTGTA